MCVTCPSCGSVQFKLAPSGNSGVCSRCGRRYPLPTFLEVLA
jgi:DNA-directed RNA polymerase subunit RPC12/RpoP